MRMIEYIKSLPEHEVTETISLNEARRVIKELAKPSAEISKNIQTSIDLIEAKKKELANNTDSKRDLEDKLYIPVSEVNATKLERPQTVCTHTKCVDYVTNKCGISTCDYKTVCHENCHLKGIEENVVNNSRIKNCKAMDKV